MAIGHADPRRRGWRGRKGQMEEAVGARVNELGEGKEQNIHEHL